MSKGATPVASSEGDESGVNAEVLLRSATFQERLEAARAQRERMRSLGASGDAGPDFAPMSKPWDAADAKLARLVPKPTSETDAVLRRITAPPELFTPQPPDLRPAKPANLVVLPRLEAPMAAATAAEPTVGARTSPSRIAIGFALGLIAGLGLAWLAFAPKSDAIAPKPVIATAPISTQAATATGTGTVQLEPDRAILAPAASDPTVRLAAPAFDIASAAPAMPVQAPAAPVPVIALLAPGALSSALADPAPTPPRAADRSLSSDMTGPPGAPQAADASLAAQDLPPQPKKADPAPAKKKVAAAAKKKKKKRAAAAPAPAPNPNSAAEAAALKKRIVTLLQGSP